MAQATLTLAALPLGRLFIAHLSLLFQDLCSWQRMPRPVFLISDFGSGWTISTNNWWLGTSNIRWHTPKWRLQQLNLWNRETICTNSEWLETTINTRCWFWKWSLWQTRRCCMNCFFWWFLKKVVELFYLLGWDYKELPYLLMVVE